MNWKGSYLLLGVITIFLKAQNSAKKRIKISLVDPDPDSMVLDPDPE